MGFFKTIFNIATLPVEVAKDIVTLGGTVTDKEKSYTRRRFEKLDEELED